MCGGREMGLSGWVKCGKYVVGEVRQANCSSVTFALVRGY